MIWAIIYNEMISNITLNRLFPFSAIMDDYGFYYLLTWQYAGASS